MKKLNIIFVIFASIFLFIFTKLSYASNSVPTYLCSKTQNINARNGPSTQFAIIYKISKIGYPFKVIEKVDHWFAVEDFKQDKMWISGSNLTSKCGKIVKLNNKAKVFSSPNVNSNTIFFLEEGYIIRNIKCYKAWCNLKINGQSGWIVKSELWN